MTVEELHPGNRMLRLTDWKRWTPFVVVSTKKSSRSRACRGCEAPSERLANLRLTEVNATVLDVPLCAECLCKTANGRSD